MSEDRVPGAGPAMPRRDFIRAVSSAAIASGLGVGATAGFAANGARTAVVIGAGIAGLSAAWELRKAGFAVRIFEKWEFVGGRMRDAWMGPIWGPPHALGISEANREMFALGAELGIGDQLAGDAGSDEFMVDNGVGTYQSSLSFRIDHIRTIPGMSEETRGRLARLRPDLERWGRETDFCLMTSGAAEDDESIGHYYERMLGKEAAREVIDYWVDVVLNAWGWPAYQTSKMAIMPWFAEQEARVVVPRGGIGVLTQKLGESMPVETNTTVRYVSPADAEGRHTIHYLTPRFERASVTPDVVVCATEGKYVPSLIQGLDRQQRQFFEAIDFTKGGGVSYILKDGFAPTEPVFGAYTPNHPDPLKRKVTLWGASAGDPTRKGQPARAQILLSRAEFIRWQGTNTTLPEYCLPILRQLYPSLPDEAIADVVVSGTDDLIYIPVGYIRQAAAILRAQESRRRGLYFAGEYMAGAHTGAACASGRTVARCIARHWA